MGLKGSAQYQGKKVWPLHTLPHFAFQLGSSFNPSTSGLPNLFRLKYPRMWSKERFSIITTTIFLIWLIFGPISRLTLSDSWFKLESDLGFRLFPLDNEPLTLQLFQPLLEIAQPWEERF